MKDPYAVLGVPRTASDDELKRAYHKLAKRLHPDLNPGKPATEQQFKEVTHAYELLSDPARRQRFDRGEIDADGNERARGFRQSDWRGTGAEGFSMDEVFAEFLGRGRRPAQGAGARQKTAEPRQARLRLGFLEAARGGKRRVELPGGRSIDVTVPAGIESGQKLRLRDAGSETLLEVEIEPHPFFTRNARDILAEIPVTLVEAVLGATITVPTVQGAVTVKIPPGSNSGSRLRLKGKGIATAEGTGDQYVKLQVVLPDPPDRELTDFLARWADGHGYDVRAKLDAG